MPKQIYIGEAKTPVTVGDEFFALPLDQQHATVDEIAKSLPQVPNEGGQSTPQRGVVDKLLGIGGERYQTWPERAARGVFGAPKALVEAAGSNPAGSREATEAMIAPAAESAMIASPASRALKGTSILKALPQAKAPTQEALRESADVGYDAARSLPVRIDPKSTSALSKKISDELLKDGYRDYLAPKTFRAIEELKAPADPKFSTIADIDGVRKLLNRAGADPVEKDAVRVAIEHIDNALSVFPELKNARGDYAAFKRSEMVTDALEKAIDRAGRTGKGANIDNVMRQEIGKILDNPKKIRGFSQEEKEAMRKVVRGTKTGNIARKVGMMAPTGSVGTAIGSGLGGLFGAGVGSQLGHGSMLSGGIGGAALPVIGQIGKSTSDAMTRRLVKQVEEQIRSRSPLAQKGQSQPQGSNVRGLQRHPLAELLARLGAGSAPLRIEVNKSPQAQ